MRGAGRCALHPFSIPAVNKSLRLNIQPPRSTLRHPPSRCGGSRDPAIAVSVADRRTAAENTRLIGQQREMP